MKISQFGIDFIKDFEGFYSSPYICPAGVATIGYGSTRYENGVKVKISDSPIDRERGESLLKNTLLSYEKTVNDKLKVPVSQKQFDMLVSHTYNTGGSDTLFKLINEKAEMSAIINWWTTRYITGGGKVLNGLVRRRKKEAEIFEKSPLNS